MRTQGKHNPAMNVRIYSAKCKDELQQAIQSRLLDSMTSAGSSTSSHRFVLDPRKLAAVLEIVPLNMTSLLESNEKAIRIQRDIDDICT